METPPPRAKKGSRLDASAVETPERLTEESELLAFRTAFNKAAFGIDNDGRPLDENITTPNRTRGSKLWTRSQWAENLEILEKWNNGTEEEIKEFRRLWKSKYDQVKKYVARELHLPSGGIIKNIYELGIPDHQELHLRNDRLIVPQLGVFDAIHEVHRVGHRASASTWNLVKEKYGSVTEKHVKKFIALCPTCIQKPPAIRLQKGASHPIRSLRFRDRFQVDLIDFRANPQKDIYGTVRWLMVMKDHFSKLCYCRGLPQKKAKFVAYELDQIFGFIGYPSIFHTDNGKEFVAKNVLAMLKELNPNIITVTGRPRKPNDQGSVENANKFIKGTIQTLETQERDKGKEANWTRLIGTTMAAVNKHISKGSNATSAYRCVYGFNYDFDEPLCCQIDTMRQCTTVEDRIRLENNPESHFTYAAKTLCVLGDNDNGADGGKQDGEQTGAEEEEEDFWEKDDSSNEDEEDVELHKLRLAREEEDADDSGIQQGGEQTQLKPPSPKMYKQAIIEIKDDEDDEKPLCFEPGSHLTKTTVTKFKRNYSLDEAMSLAKKRNENLNEDDRKPYVFVYPRLLCKQCCFTGQHLLCIGDDKYTQDCAETQMWYDTDFISTAATLMAHEAHDPRIQLIHCHTPNCILEKDNCRELDEGVQCVVSVFYAAAHYSVMEANIASRSIVILDGKKYGLGFWQNHIVHVLRRCRLIGLEETITWTELWNKSLNLKTEDGNEWNVIEDAYILQEDDYSCGPIALMKVMNTLGRHGRGNKKARQLTGLEIRQNVVEKYQDLLQKYGSSLQVVAPAVLIELLDEDEQSSCPQKLEDSIKAEADMGTKDETGHFCIICQGTVDHVFGLKNMSIRYLKCCGMGAHSACILFWSEHSSVCPFCRTPYFGLLSRRTLKLPPKSAAEEDNGSAGCDIGQTDNVTNPRVDDVGRESTARHSESDAAKKSPSSGGLGAAADDTTQAFAGSKLSEETFKTSTETSEEVTGKNGGKELGEEEVDGKSGDNGGSPSSVRSDAEKERDTACKKRAGGKELGKEEVDVIDGKSGDDGGSPSSVRSDAEKERDTACKKRAFCQEIQSASMVKRRSDTRTRPVELGCIVTVKSDIRDVGNHASGVVGIVFAVHGEHKQGKR